MAIQLDCVEGMSRSLHKLYGQPAKLCSLQESVRIAITHGFAADDAAVSGCHGPVFRLFVYAVLRKPLDDLHFFLEVSHATRDVLILGCKNGRFGFRPFGSSHLAKISIIFIMDIAGVRV